MKLTFFVEETLTIRKEVTVECDPNNDDMDKEPEELVRQEFSKGLSGIFTNGYEIIRSDGLEFFLTEEDADEGTSCSPNEICFDE